MIVWLQLIFYETNTIRTQWFVVYAYMHLKKWLQLEFMVENLNANVHGHFTLSWPKTLGTSKTKAQTIKAACFIAPISLNIDDHTKIVNWSHMRATGAKISWNRQNVRYATT